MSKLLEIGYARGLWLVPLVLLIATVMGGIGLQLSVDVSADALLPQKDENWRDYEHVRDTFGSDRLTSVYLGDKNLFTYEKLLEFEKLSDDLSALKIVHRVESLATVPDIRSDEDYIDSAPVINAVKLHSDNKVWLEQRRQNALENPLLRRNIISEDGEATLLTLYLNDRSDSLTPPEITQHVQKVLDQYEGKFEELYQVGGPSLETSMLTFLMDDQMWIFPIAGGILFLLLSFNLRSFILGILPVLNAFLAVAITAGIMVLMGLPINLLNYILPALILIVGATEDVHLIHEFRRALSDREEGESPRIAGSKAIQKTGKALGLTVLLTALTTILGFSATSLSTLPILQQFGLSAAIGMSIRFALTILFLPGLLGILQPWLILRSKSEKAGQESERRLTNAFTEWVMKTVAPRPKWIIAVALVLAIPSLWMGSQIRLSNDLIGFLGEDSPIVQDLNHVAERLVGTKVVYVTIKGQEGAFKSPARLRQLMTVTDHLRQSPEVNSAISFADLVGRVYGQLHQIQDQIPPSEKTVEQFTLLFFHPTDIEPYVSSDFSEANIVLRCHVNDSTEFNAFLERTRQELSSGDFGPLIFTVIGKSVLISEAVDRVSIAQIMSLGSMVLLLFLIVTTLFVSVRCGGLTVLSNLLPISIIFGVMGALGIPLNVGTCMVAAVTLGIAIDDTLHLLVRYNHKLNALKDEKAAVGAALRAEFIPVLATSMALAGGFAVLGLSSFAPVQQFGLLSAGVILLAVAVDLIITPSLFSSIRLITLWDLMGLSLRRALLRRSPFFAGLSSYQAKKVILATHVEEYPAGSFVIREGDPGDRMFVVIQGKLEVSLNRDGGRVRVSRLRLGDVFGEVSVVSNTPRTADIIALTDTRLLALDADSLESLRKFSPYLASRIFLNLTNILGHRLVATSAKVQHDSGENS